MNTVERPYSIHLRAIVSIDEDGVVYATAPGPEVHRSRLISTAEEVARQYVQGDGMRPANVVEIHLDGACVRRVWARPRFRHGDDIPLSVTKEVCTADIVEAA